MKITINLEHGEGDHNPFFIPTLIQKDGVETLHDMAYLWDHVTRSAGFTAYDGVSYYTHDGSDIATSSQIDSVHFGYDSTGNKVN